MSPVAVTDADRRDSAEALVWGRLVAQGGNEQADETKE